MKRLWICLFVSFLFLAPSFAAADLLTNPSFEAGWTGQNPVYTGSDYAYNPTDGAGLGWTFSGGSGVSKSNTAWFGVAQDGNQFAFLQVEPSSISQTFALGSASNVTLSFYMELRPSYNVGQQIAVSMDGNLPVIFDSSLGWTQQAVDFGTLSAGPHTLAFAGTRDYSTYGDTTAFLDNVQLASTPVPEPATMLLLGSGLIGLAGLRRKFGK